MIEKIDQWLIDHTQNVVDLTGLKPAWWIRWSGIVMVLAAIIRLAFHDMSVLGVIATTLMGSCIVLGSASDAYIAAMGSFPFVRYYLVVATVVTWCLSTLMKQFSVGMLVTDMAWLCAYYFAACKPPRPRKKTQTKTKLAFS